MRDRIRLLSLVVTATVLLLAGSAVLVVLGIFNGYLHWDLFSPEIEKVLYGIFASFVALGAFGAAISFVLGIQEVVLSFRRLTDRSATAVAPPAGVASPVLRQTSWRFYPAALTGLLILLALTILGFNYANHRVLAHRLEVFKLVVRDQMTQLGPRLASEVVRLGAPCDSCGTPALEQLMKTLQNLSFCRSAVLYLPDPADATVLWRYPPTASCSTCEKYNPERFFIARDLDRAVQLALSGDTAWVDQMNRDPMFHWYHVIRGADGKSRAVLEIWGNDQESFRDYEAGAKAAAKR